MSELYRKKQEVLTKLDQIGAILKDNPTQVSIEYSEITVGDLRLKGTATLDTSVNGIGGIDTGVLNANTFYNVFAVDSGAGALALIASSDLLPLNQTNFKAVGGFFVDGSSLVDSVSGTETESEHFKAYHQANFYTTLSSNVPQVIDTALILPSINDSRYLSTDSITDPAMTRIVANERISLEITATAGPTAGWQAAIADADGNTISATQPTTNAYVGAIAANVVLDKNEFVYLHGHLNTLDGGITLKATPVQGVRKDISVAGVAPASNSGSTSSSGELNFYEKGTIDLATDADYTQGSNATFDGAGADASTLTLTTSAAEVGRGVKSIKWELNASASGSVDDYFATAVIDIPVGYRGRTLGFKAQSKYDGADGDIAIRIKDNSNNAILTDDTIVLEATSQYKDFVFSFYCPASCQQIKLGGHVLAHATGGEIMFMDDIVITPDPFVYGAFVKEAEYFTSGQVSNFWDSLSSNINDFDESLVTGLSGSKYVKIVNDTDDDRIVAKERCKVHLNFQLPQHSGGLGPSILHSNGSAILSYNEASGDNNAVDANASVILEVDEYVWCETGSGNKQARTGGLTLLIEPLETSEHIVTPLQNVHPVRYTTSSATTIATATDTFIDFDTKTTDVDGLVLGAGSDHVTTTETGWRYIVPSKGQYIVNSFVTFLVTTAWAEGESIYVKIFKNGSSYSQKEQSGYSTASLRASGEISDLVIADKNDVIEIVVYQSSGASVALGSGAVSIHKIDSNAVLGAFPKTKWQEKFMSADNNQTDLDWAGLEIGKTYKITLRSRAIYNNTINAAYRAAYSHDGDTILDHGHNHPGSGGDGTDQGCTSTVIFTATATTLEYSSTTFGAGTALRGNGTRDESYAQLEEILAEQVTQWT